MTYLHKPGGLFNFFVDIKDIWRLLGSFLSHHLAAQSCSACTPWTVDHSGFHSVEFSRQNIEWHIPFSRGSSHIAIKWDWLCGMHQSWLTLHNCMEWPARLLLFMGFSEAILEGLHSPPAGSSWPRTVPASSHCRGFLPSEPWGKPNWPSTIVPKGSKMLPLLLNCDLILRESTLCGWPPHTLTLPTLKDIYLNSMKSPVFMPPSSLIIQNLPFQKKKSENGHFLFYILLTVQIFFLTLTKFPSFSEWIAFPVLEFWSHPRIFCFHSSLSDLDPISLPASLNFHYCRTRAPSFFSLPMGKGGLEPLYPQICNASPQLVFQQSWSTMSSKWFNGAHSQSICSRILAH